MAAKHRPRTLSPSRQGMCVWRPQGALAGDCEWHTNVRRPSCWQARLAAFSVERGCTVWCTKQAIQVRVNSLTNRLLQLIDGGSAARGRIRVRTAALCGRRLPKWAALEYSGRRCNRPSTHWFVSSTIQHCFRPSPPSQICDGTTTSMIGRQTCPGKQTCRDSQETGIATQRQEPHMPGLA